MEEKKSFRAWIKQHKSELIAASVSVAALLAALYFFKNRAAIKTAWVELERLIASGPKGTTSKSTPMHLAPIPVAECVEEYANAQTRAPHGVSEHLRMLPLGRHASAGKIASASAHGFVLLPGQTWVTSYRTGEHAA